MEGLSLIFLFLAALFGFLAIGVPIAHTLVLVAVTLLIAIDNFEPQFVAQSVIYGANSFTLLAIPFFILAGEIMSYGGISKRIVHFVASLVARPPADRLWRWPRHSRVATREAAVHRLPAPA